MAVRLLAGTPYPNESSRAMQACNGYLRMGPARSLRKLLQKYSKTRQYTAPTDSINTLEDWSTSFRWVERASEYDAELEEQKNLRRRKELETGLALDNERVRKLKRMAKFLEEQIYEETAPSVVIGPGGAPIEVQPIDKHHKVWLRDVKQVGATKEEIVRFNSAILSEFRGVLDDLAKEVGGRKQKIDHGGEIATVQMTIEQWRRQKQVNRQQAASTLQDFDDE